MSSAVRIPRGLAPKVAPKLVIRKASGIVLPNAVIVERLAGLTETQAAVAAPYLVSVLEAAETDNLGKVDINEFRKGLNLKRLLNPTITEIVGVVLPLKSKPLAERIAEGGYEYASSDITADRFPITLDAGSRQLVLAHFGVDVSSEEVMVWVEANGYELALHEDLEVVGSRKEDKELQQQSPIIALGSFTTIFGRQFVPCICGVGECRYLRLRWRDNNWRDVSRFLLVHEAA